MALTGFVVHFKASTSKPGKVADAELHFIEGPLKGYKLTGFCVWELRQHIYNCTFPMRPYSVGKQHRKQELLARIAEGPDVLRDCVVLEYQKFIAANAPHPQRG